jgi:hypothetical protein
MANALKRTVVVVQPCINESLVSESGRTGVSDDNAANNGRQTSHTDEPWPAQCGWDFPFNAPKLVQ